jgi:thioesterase domain-containing protein
MIALSTQQWKIVGLCVAGLVLIGIVLFTFQTCGNYFSGRDINKARANVNAALVEVKAAKEVVANDRVDEAVALDHVKQAANDVVSASTATDEAKTAANQAVANYEAAVKEKRPTGTTEADLDEKLRALGQ